MQIERSVLATRSAIGAPRPRPNGRILCYHSVGTPAWGVNDVHPQNLRRHIEAALALGYRFVATDEIRRTGGTPRDLAITFDDGLLSVAAYAAPILRDLQVPWTLFVVTAWADGKHGFGDGVLMGWSEIESLAAQGATIGSHSVTHRNLRFLEPGEVASELFESRRTILDRTGITATTFAIPFGQSRDWPTGASAVARSAGYEAIYAQSEHTRPPETMARTFISRFDDERVFRAALRGAFDYWEEWL
jgi:peptidoglycan/xylan/chitin deacetylase (PgdA/CDA1 family)